MRKSVKNVIFGAVFAVFMMVFMLSVTSVNAHAEHEHVPAGGIDFQWNFDRSACNASYICAECGETVVEACALQIDAVILPTCTERGTAKFVASFTRAGKYHEAVIYQKDIPVKGHSFTKYVDNGNGTSSAFCDHGCGAVDTVNVAAAETQQTEGTACGKHSYNAASYTWNGDNSKCRVLFQCEKCGQLTSVDCLVTMDAYTWPTEDHLGTTEYVATAVIDGKTFQEKIYRADIPLNEYAKTHPAPAGVAYASEKTVEEAKTMGKVHVTPTGTETADSSENTQETSDSNEEIADDSEEDTTEKETTEEETTAEESVEEETTVEETTVEETTEEETTTVEETTVEETSVEETETTVEETTVEETTVENSSDSEPKEGKTDVTSVYILIVIAVLLFFILIALCVLIFRKINLNKKHEDIKQKIKDELK